MQVENHLLINDDGSKVRFERTPNVGRGAFHPKYCVMHYTAGKGLDYSVGWLTNPDSSASAHLVIGEDGEVVQLAPFNRATWHAGRSRWLGIKGLNKHSISIELENPGALARSGASWKSWFGALYPDADVIEAVHKHQTVPKGWRTFPQVQIDAALDVALAVTAAYGLVDVLGHDDIAVGRREDPGPAFPMTSFRLRVFGRREDRVILHKTITELNIRSGPGSSHPQLEGSPLPAGTRVEIQYHSGNWAFVDVPGGANGVVDLEGWVHSGYLMPLEG